jgi:myo-inositol-1(or 4)-monophosphatase
VSTLAERARLAAVARLVAEEAGALALRGHRSRPVADRKGRHDLVTEFDRASEALLLARLAALTPDIPVVGEESSTGGTAPRSGLCWYVDPIDGTTNFVHGHPFWCVAVGLCEDDQPVAGAVVAPSLRLSWVGWIDPAGAATAALRDGQPCRVSETAALEESMLGTGFPAQRELAPGNNFDSFVAVKKQAQAVRRCGSAAIDLCLVADGTYDGYWERTLHAWDTVAASAVVLAAGGRVTALDGGVMNHHAGNVVASNGRIHAELVAAIRAG